MENEEVVTFVPRKPLNIIVPDDPADANRCDGCE